MSTNIITSIRHTFEARFARSGAADSDAALERAGETWFRRSNYLFGGVALIAIVVAIIDDSVPLGQRLASVPLMLGLGWWFVDRICMVDSGFGRRARIYLLVALPVFLLLAALHPAYRLLAFAAYWQVFALLRLREAIATSVLLAIGILATFGGEGVRFPLSTSQDWTVFVVSASCGGLMAAFIHSILNEAVKRQELIEELESTRSLLAAEERRSGALGERQRIAGEIHDTIAQDLTSVIMHLEAAESRLGAGSGQANAHIDQARSAARSGLNEARRIVQALLPEIVTGNSLSRALETIASRWSGESGIPTTYELVGADPGRDPSRDIVVVRALQEGLVNVQRHAEATRVRITLTNLDDVLLLDVNDDGVGVDASSLRPSVGLQMGLRALEERARSIGGSLTVESGAREGTTLSISIPASHGVSP